MLERSPDGDDFILLEDFNTHLDNDSGLWRGVATTVVPGRNSLSDLNLSDVLHSMCCLLWDWRNHWSPTFQLENSIFFPLR